MSRTHRLNRVNDPARYLKNTVPRVHSTCPRLRLLGLSSLGLILLTRRAARRIIRPWLNQQDRRPLQAHYLRPSSTYPSGVPVWYRVRG